MPLPLAWESVHAFPTANLGNPGLCPGTARLEEEVVAMLLDLFHAPPLTAQGQILSGGTEANLMALWMAREFTGGTEVVLPSSAHFSLTKAARLLGLTPSWVPVDAHGRMQVQGAARRVRRRTAAVVGLAGSTELGAVDTLDELSRLALSRGVPLHVDAAFGGFVLPFRHELGLPGIPFDFSLPGVTSMTVDPHKMGMAPIPTGSLLTRDRELWRCIEVASPYLTDPTSRSLLGTRPSSSVAGCFAAMMSMGRQGYQGMVRRALALTGRLRSGLEALGLPIVTEPTMNIVAARHPNPRGLQNALLERGWDVSAIREPPALRFVVMPHATRVSVDGLLRELAGILRTHPSAARSPRSRGSRGGAASGRGRTGRARLEPEEVRLPRAPPSG